MISSPFAQSFSPAEQVGGSVLEAERQRMPRKKFRDRRPAWDRLPYGVREISPGLWQLRVWFGGFKNAHHNFGCYPSIYEAARVGRKALALKAQGLGYLAVLARLKASGDVPPHVLPRWVYAIEDGKFGARCRWPRKGKMQEVSVGPFGTPEKAYMAMESALSGMPANRLPAGRRFTTSDYQARG